MSSHKNTFFFIYCEIWELVRQHYTTFQIEFSFLFLQGYSRDTSFLEMVVDIILELKKANPSLVYGERRGLSLEKAGSTSAVYYTSHRPSHLARGL